MVNEHLMDMMAGWFEFVAEAKGDNENADTGNPLSPESEILFQFYQASGILSFSENYSAEQKEILIREFFEELIFPYIFHGKLPDWEMWRNKINV